MAINNGYYEKKLHNEVVLTEANMKLFEQDIKEGKPLDLTKYQTNEKHDYGNLFSNTGYFLGNKLSDLMVNGTGRAITVLKKLFTNG